LKIRVLLIGPDVRWITGGQGVQADRLRRIFADHAEVALDFQAIGPKLEGGVWDGPLSFLQKAKGIRTLFAMGLYWVQLFSRAWRYDILHVFTAAYWSYNFWTLPALLAAKLFGKKIILNYRDGQCEDHLQNWPLALPTIRMMDAVVSNSGFLKDVFARYGVKAQSIFNTIDREQFPYRKRSRLTPRIYHNRILEPIYNIPCALRAFKRVQQEIPETEIRIAHTGPLADELAAYAKEIGLRNCEFLGRIPPKDQLRWYDWAEVYVTTPDIDCMPGSLLECYSCGLPVVATKAGGIPYIAEDGRNALLVEKDDEAGVAAAVLRLLREPELVERLTENGRADVLAYREERVGSEWAEKYKSFINQ
jgi:L-malate glycosyltransferase